MTGGGSPKKHEGACVCKLSPRAPSILRIARQERLKAERPGPWEGKVLSKRWLRSFEIHDIESCAPLAQILWMPSVQGKCVE